MRLVKVLAMSLVFWGVSSSVTAIAASGADDKSAKDYISRIRIGSWVGDNALLVMPDRNAAAVPTGTNFEGAKLVAISDTCFTVDYGGVQSKVTLDPGWQLMTQFDMNNWLAGFMSEVGTKIDSQKPDVTHESVIRISSNGAVSGDNIKVQQARPYPSLPDWMESIDVKISINPHEPTKVRFMTCVVTKQSYDRLCKSLYSKALESSNAAPAATPTK